MSQDVPILMDWAEARPMVLSFAPGWWTPREMCGCPMRRMPLGEAVEDVEQRETKRSSAQGTRPNFPASFLKYVVGLSNLLNYFKLVGKKIMDVVHQRRILLRCWGSAASQQRPYEAVPLTLRITGNDRYIGFSSIYIHQFTW